MYLFHFSVYLIFNYVNIWVLKSLICVTFYASLRLYDRQVKLGVRVGPRGQKTRSDLSDIAREISTVLVATSGVRALAQASRLSFLCTIILKHTFPRYCVFHTVEQSAKYAAERCLTIIMMQSFGI